MQLQTHSHPPSTVSLSEFVAASARWKHSSSFSVRMLTLLFTIEWVVDGLYQHTLTIIQRGISVSSASSSGTVQSTLTVPATSVNNGTTVYCVVYPAVLLTCTLAK